MSRSYATLPLARREAALNRHGRAAATAADAALRYGERAVDGSIVIGPTHAKALEQAVERYRRVESGESLS